MKNFSTLKLEFNNNGYTVLYINRPEKLNALNTTVLKELSKAVDNLKETKVLIITGEGKAFVAGADIAEMQSKNTMEGRELSKLGNNVFKKIENLNIPVIAAINGYALGGGCELALSCDIRIASEYAKFGQPEVSLGIIPGFGGTQRLARATSETIAKELIFTGDIINSDKALSLGLVNYVVKKDDLLNKSIELAEKIIKNSKNAVSLAKQSINRGLNLPLENGLNLESDIFGLSFSHTDQKEGMSAFLEKRKPNFK